MLSAGVTPQAMCYAQYRKPISAIKISLYGTSRGRKKYLYDSIHGKEISIRMRAFMVEKSTAKDCVGGNLQVGRVLGINVFARPRSNMKC